MNEAQKKFWDNCHLEGKPEHLSGVPGEVVVSCLGIASLINPDVHVLEIGVGFGTCFKYLKNLTASIYAVDISQRALDRVADISSGSWLEEHMQFIPNEILDLAYTFNVIQHIELATFSKHLKYIYAALKPGGIFAFHFIYRIDGGPGELEHSGALQAGMITHNPRELKALAETYGYKIYKEINLGRTEVPDIGAYVLQVQKPS